MSNCLVVTSLEKSESALRTLLKGVGVQDVVIVRSGNEARRALNNMCFDLVMINSPLSDEFGHDLCNFIYENHTSSIILLVKNQVVEEFAHKLNRIGVMCVSKPLDRNIFNQSVRLASAANIRLKGIHNENKKLHQKVDELKLISRAKYVLMDYLNMSESEAHHYIEKKAMDNRISKVNAAKEILKTYE